MSAVEVEPPVGAEAVCRTCLHAIWWEVGTVGNAERLGWSDRIARGGDSVVCFSAIHYRHAPLEGREAAIFEAARKRGATEAVAAFKAAASMALDRKATEWAEEFAETDSDADYGRWDAWVNAARIVRNHPT